MVSMISYPNCGMGVRAAGALGGGNGLSEASNELRAVFECEPDAQLLAGRDRHGGGDALTKGALQFIVAGEIAVRPVFRERRLKMRLRE